MYITQPMDERRGAIIQVQVASPGGFDGMTDDEILDSTWYLFAIDSGAAECALTQEMVDHIGLQPSDRRFTLGGVTGTSEERPGYYFDIAIGMTNRVDEEKVFIHKGICAPVIDSMMGIHTPALMGRSLFKKGGLTFQMQNGLFSLIMPESPDSRLRRSTSL